MVETPRLHVAVWEHILDFYQAADPAAPTFSANILSHFLRLVANYPAAYQALTDTDRDFIAKLEKRISTSHPEVGEVARELLRQSRIRH